MNAIDENAIRIAILRCLYEDWKTEPMGFTGDDELEDTVGADHNAIERNVGYLEDKGLLTVPYREGTGGFGARITAYGVDFVEGESPFNPGALRVRVEGLALDPRQKEEAVKAVDEIIEALNRAGKKATFLSQLGDQGRKLAVELLASIVRGYLFNP